ncbi:MAG: hypothetical protein IT579_15775, partial [Verrucomicrobia subdivision 3 bacterium]|nr:hypothetical protein [Limisphaerales bacterium]
MAEWLWPRLRSAVPELGGVRWGLGAAVALVAGGVSILLNARALHEHSATALLKLEFIRADGVALNLKQYGTNELGGKPIITEAQAMCSELFLRKAQQRLAARPAATGSEGQLPHGRSLPGRPERPQWSLVPTGVRISLSGPDARQTAALVNEIAQVYQDERNGLFPAPPGCKTLAISLQEKAEPSSQRPNLVLYLRLALGAILLGLAVASWPARSPPEPSGGFLRRFGAWFAWFFGIALLILPLRGPVGLAGAILLACLLTASERCIALVSSPQSPVPARLLKYT